MFTKTLPEETEEVDDDRVLADKGKQFYRFKYETCKSNGPAKPKDFEYDEHPLLGIGDGKWEEHEEEVCCEHQDEVEPCDC